MIQCKKCLEEKDASCFRLRKNGRHHSLTCIECSNKVSIQKYKSISLEEKIKLLGRVRERSYKKNFNITIEDYDRILKEQEFKCAICSITEKESIQLFGTRLHVDHDHESGQVRGLLCFDCNTGLGLFKDSEEFLLNAAKYVEDAL
jgi:hypothetical protein